MAIRLVDRTACGCALILAVAFIVIASVFIGTGIWHETRLLIHSVQVSGAVVATSEGESVSLKVGGAPTTYYYLYSHTIQLDGAATTVSLASTYNAPVGATVVVRVLDGQAIDILRFGELGDVTLFDTVSGRWVGVLGILLIIGACVVALVLQLWAFKRVVVEPLYDVVCRGSGNRIQRLDKVTRILPRLLLYTATAALWVMVVWYMAALLIALPNATTWRHGVLVVAVPAGLSVPLVVLIERARSYAGARQCGRLLVRVLVSALMIISFIVLVFGMLKGGAEWLTPKNIAEHILAVLSWMLGL